MLSYYARRALRRTRRWQLHRLHPSTLQDSRELRRKQRVAIVDQVPLSDQKAFRSVDEVAGDLTHPKAVRLPRHSGDLNPTAGQIRTRNLVKPLRVQASIVKKSAAAIPSRCRDKNSFQVVCRSRSGAGSSPRSFRMLAIVLRAI
jgi:hypothetical protein